MKLTRLVGVICAFATVGFVACGNGDTTTDDGADANAGDSIGDTLDYGAEHPGNKSHRAMCWNLLFRNSQRPGRLHHRLARGSSRLLDLAFIKHIGAGHAGVQAVRIGTTGGDTLSVKNLFDIPVKGIVAASRKPL